MKRTAALLILLSLLTGCATAPTPTPLVATPPAAPTATAFPTMASRPSPAPSVTPTAVPPAPLTLGELWQYGDEFTEAFWTLDAADLDADGAPEILAGSHDRHLYALTDGGDVLWEFPTLAAVYSAAVVTTADGALLVAVGDDSDHVYFVGADGALRWQVKLDGRGTHLVATPDMIAAGTWSGSVYGLDLAGNVKWQVGLPAAPTSLEVADVAGADLVVGTTSGEAVGVGTDGATVWQRKVADAPVYVRGSSLEGIALLAGDQRGRMTASDREGRIVWEFDAGGGMPVWVEAQRGGASVLLVGSGQPENRVTALSRQGKVLWSTDVPGGVWHLLAADVDGDGSDEILASTEGGTVSALSLDGYLRGVWQSPSRVVQAAVLPPAAGQPPLIVLREGRFVHALSVAGDRAPTAPQPVPPTLAEWDGSLLDKDGAVLLAAGGDVMLARTVEEYAGKYGLSYPFGPVAATLAQADIAVANLECNISLDGEPLPGKTFVFRAHPEMTDALGQSGLTAMSLANNHILDFGVGGFTETFAHLELQGIDALGAGMSSEEAAQPLIQTIRGVRVAIVAFVSYAPPAFAATSSRPGVNFLDDFDRMTQSIRAAREQADVVIMILHGGKEYSPTSDAAQQLAAHLAIDAGADLVVGHHPHVLQETEIYRDRLIVYSLGDFLFDIDNLDAARDGALLWVWLTESGVQRAELWYTRIVHDAQVRFVAGPDGDPKRTALLPAP